MRIEVFDVNVEFIRIPPHGKFARDEGRLSPKYFARISLSKTGADSLA